MNPQVSILLPVRNGAQTLPRALESCLAQTWRDFELIAANDGSRDRTAGIIREYARRDARVIFLDLPSGPGLTAALQEAHRRSSGPLIARMDADDYAYPDRLEIQVRFLESRPEIAGCGCGVRILDVKTGGRPRAGYAHYECWLNHLTDSGTVSRERFIESPVAHPAALVRRAAFEAAGGYRECEWPEDYDLWLRMLEAGFLLANVPQVLLDWYDKPDRLSRTSGRYSQASFLRAKAHYLSHFAQVRTRGVMISGAGPIGKQFARLLSGNGIAVRAFVEVHPRRIGNKIAGVPVVSEKDLEPCGPGSPVQLAAVGQKGRREQIRAFLSSRGYREGESFFCVA